MPISMGKSKTLTDNGAYIIGDRYSFLVMDSSTYGVPVNSPDGSRTEVEWATQMCCCPRRRPIVPPSPRSSYNLRSSARYSRPSSQP